jgi:hypothetical protein
VIWTGIPGEGPVEGSCKHGNEPLGCLKMLENS